MIERLLFVALIIVAGAWILFPILALLELRELNRQMKIAVDHLLVMRKYYEPDKQPLAPLSEDRQPRREALRR